MEISFWEIWEYEGGGKEEGRRREGDDNVRGVEKWREQERWDEKRREMESKERVILIEGAIMGLARNLTLEKFPGIHKDDSS